MDLNLNDVEPTMWIEALPHFHAETIKAMLEDGVSEEEIAIKYFAQTGSENTAPFGANGTPKNYFESVKNEMRKLICGDSTYEETRAEISKHWGEAKPLVLMSASAAIGSVLGISTAVLLPVVALLLMTVTKVGVQAWCGLTNG